MQVNSSVNARYYTSYRTNTSVKYCAGFSQTEDGKMTPNETTENPGFAEFVDYQEFHRAWMSQGAQTAFRYTKNEGFNAEANSISLVPGMSVRLSNGFRLVIDNCMVQALGNFKNNQAASESAAIAGALSHLIKVANGQIPMNLFYSKNQDNSAYAKTGLQAFGIDTSRPFTINGRTFHFDSDEQIRIGRGRAAHSDHQANAVSNDAEPVTAKQTGAVSIAETEDEGEFLGLTMVPEEGQSVTYGMRAMLSVQSTPDNPIVQVVSNLGGKKVIYNVEVNKVNPDNATQLEMFALLSYTDKMGITDGGTFGSHQQLEVYGGNASSIGYCSSLSGADTFLNERFDWTSIMEKMVQVYKDAGIKNQAEDCQALFEFFHMYTEQRENEVKTAIDFSRFAPNAPDEVKQAFSEAAEETGYYEYSGNAKMNHISQILVRQVENRMNGVENPQDIFGRTVASALQAAREILYDLENPLIPAGQRGENAARYIEQEKEFYRAFIRKLEALGGTDTTNTANTEDTANTTNTADTADTTNIADPEETVDYAKFLEEKINEIFEKIQNGDTEPTYQIGTQSFTEKEWEEFLDKFDSVQEAIRELMREEQEKREAEEAKKENELAGVVSAGNGLPESYGLETWYQGEKVEWSENDIKYTDPETGISYYVRDGKHPYMTEEDAEKLKELCQETGEPWLKKFAEITGMIQQLDDNTTAYVGSNGTVIKSKDGKELFIDTSSLTYDAIMSLFKDLPQNGNYFDHSFWEGRIRTVEKENTSNVDGGILLTAETTSCTYETADPDDDDIRYLTYYAEEGIFCRKTGQASGYEWSVTFENKEQYNKVMEFIGQFPSDWNMRFAAHQNFWNDFLNDEIDMEGFMEFIHGTNKGVPDFSITIGDSMYIDRDKMQWAKYTNPLGTRLYTAEEMYRMQAEIIAANQVKQRGYVYEHSEYRL